MFFKRCLSVLITLNLLKFAYCEVDICFKLKSKDFQENDESMEAVPDLLEKVNKEIEDAFGQTAGTDTYDYFHLDFTHPAITVNAKFYNGTIAYTTPRINYFNFKPEGFEVFNFTIDSYFVNGTYNMRGFVGTGLFDIYGDGEFNYTFTGLSVALLSGIKVNSTDFCIPVTLNLDMRGCKNYLGHFMGGDSELDPLLTRVFELLLPEAVVYIWREFADSADGFIQSIIDKILNNENFLRALRITLDNKELQSRSPEWINQIP